MRLRDLTAARRHGQDPESGQAVVEFALILIPLLILVVGIIQFGIGLNYWLDMNRLANQGARWAVVNGWPNCPRTHVGACTGTTPGVLGNSLPVYLKSQAATQGLQSSVAFTVCYPAAVPPDPPAGAVGSPVTVKVDSPYRFRFIMKLPTINLHAQATMRIETDKPVNHLTGNAVTPCP